MADIKTIVSSRHDARSDQDAVMFESPDSAVPASGQAMQQSALLFTFDYPPLTGGISRLCAEIKRGLAGSQVAPCVLTQEGGSRLPDESDEVRVTRRRPMREWRAFREIRKKYRGRPVICSLWYPEGLIAWLAGARPLAILAHGAELLPAVSWLRRRFWRALQRRVLESADVVIANSAFTGGIIASQAPKARVRSVPPGVDSHRFSPGDSKFNREKLGVAGKTVLCTISRVQDFKGHDVVLRAIAALAPEERAQVVYMIGGCGPYEPELKALSASLGIEANVRWLGFVAEADLPDVYRASDLFVLCTREAPRSVEGFGLVFLEAQACGVPVVGTRTGGIAEAVREGEGGWLIEPEDVPALTHIVRRVITSPESARTMGLAGRNRVLGESTWDHYIQRLCSVLRESGVLHE